MTKVLPPNSAVSSAGAIVVIGAVVCAVFGIVGATIWSGSASVDYRYLSCMSCHM